MRRFAALIAGLAVSATLTGCYPTKPPLPLPSAAKPTTTTRPAAPTTTIRPAPTTTRPVTSGGGGGGSAPKPTTTTTRPAATTTSTTARPTTTTTAAPAPAPSGVLWRSSYDGLATPADVWQHEQEQAADRLTLVDGPHGRVMRAEVRVGDVVSGGNRAEVYARHAPSHDAPAAEWPDPIGSTRWYGFDLFLPADFATDPTGLVWLTLTQWKGVKGGSPAVALEVKRDGLELAGASARNPLGPIKRGQWERIVVGVHFDPTNAGWVEVYRDGVLALPRTNRPTTTIVNGVADPIYLKQGLYRSSSWTVNHVAEFGPVSIGLSQADVS